MLGNIPATGRRIANLSIASFTLALLCLIAFPLAAQQQSQQTGDPVADAAAPFGWRYRSDEDNIPRAPRNEGAAPAAPAAPTDGAAQATAQAQGTAAAKGPDAAPAAAGGEAAKTPEETWRARFKAQHGKIARAEKELELLQREVSKAQTEYYPDPQKALKEQNTRGDINEKNAKIAAKQKEIDNLKQGLADMQDELRKSGGDSGWARE